MTPDEARHDISRLVTGLLKNGLAVAYNPPVVRVVGPVRRVFWATAPADVSGGITPFGTVADYRRLLEHQQYNAVLFDGALIQAIFDFRNGRLVKHNLTYYPCPVRVPSQEDLSALAALVDDVLHGSLETLEWLAPLGDDASATPREYFLWMRSPLRFDFDEDAAGDLHPASHLHLGEPDCRIPVHAPIDFASFMRFVFRSYYVDRWRDDAFLQGLSGRDLPRCVSREDEAELFLERRRGVLASGRERIRTLFRR